MASFEKAIKEILKHEGGYVNNPNDPGGITNKGVTLRLIKDHPELGDFDLDGDVDAEDIKNMTVENATKIYKDLWWDKFGYGKFTNDAIALKVFDFAVNAGASRSHKILQASINSFGMNLTVDGILGNATFQVVNHFADGDVDKLLATFRTKQYQFYVDIATKNPKLQVFLKGWEHRAKAC